MLLSLVQPLFRAWFSRNFALISIDGLMRSDRKPINWRIRTGLFDFCTNPVFTFLISPYPLLLVGMLLAFVQPLFRAWFSRQFERISICGLMRWDRKPITWRVGTGLCAFCTYPSFTFLKSIFPQLLVGILLALVQPLFRAWVSRQFA